jgi:hypothetical protein
MAAPMDPHPSVLHPRPSSSHLWAGLDHVKLPVLVTAFDILGGSIVGLFDVDRHSADAAHELVGELVVGHEALLKVLNCDLRVGHHRNGVVETCQKQSASTRCYTPEGEWVNSCYTLCEWSHRDLPPRHACHMRRRIQACDKGMER